MKPYIIAYVVVISTYLILDGIWLGLVAQKSYIEAMESLIRQNIHIWPWIAFYTLYSFAIVYLVVIPNLSNSWKAVAIAGALLGMASYGAYNMTNYALIKDWPLSITFTDWGWGIFVTSVSSLSGFYVLKIMKPYL